MSQIKPQILKPVLRKLLKVLITVQHEQMKAATEVNTEKSNQIIYLATNYICKNGYL